MRVLIITHPRSGGRSLTHWISAELELEMIHEVFNDNHDDEFLKKIYVSNNIATKVIYEKLKRRYVDIFDLSKRFDRVICNVRNDDRDTAISMVYQLLNPQNGVDIPNWHEVYNVDDKWIEDNKDMIDKELSWMESARKEIENLNIDCLRTSYEGIFKTGEDIPILLEYLGIKEPFHLDVLNTRHKLRNGDVGMSYYSKKIILPYVAPTPTPTPTPTIIEKHLI